MSDRPAPRLVLVADEPQFAGPLAGAEFAFHFGRFLAELHRRPQLTPADCGLWLRAHDRGWLWWGEQLQRMAWLAQAGVAIGISAPKHSDGEPPPADLPIRITWLQVSEAQAQRWPCGGIAVARSCHDAAGVAAALAAGAAWVTLSPVLPTPSKPGHVGLGWSLFADVARRHPGRVVALGGLGSAHVAQALQAGAAGVAVLRAWTGEPKQLVAACGT